MDSFEKAKRRSTVTALVLGVPLSALLLWLAVRNVDLGDVRKALQASHPVPVALAVGAFAIVYSLQGERWRRIAAVKNVGRRRFVEMVVSGVACNNILPGRVGDLLRARWLGVAAGIPGGRAFATVVLDRGCDLAALFVFLIVSLPAVTGAPWIHRIAAGALAVLVALVLVLLAARAYTSTRDRARRSRSLLRRLVRDAVEGLAEPLGRRRLATVLGLSLAAWASFALAAHLIARALGFGLSLEESLFVTAVVNLGVAIPSSPGFVGTYQWLAVSALGLFDVGRVDALAFAILLHATWYVPTTLVGGGALAVRGLRRLSARRAMRPTASPSRPQAPPDSAPPGRS